MDPKLRSLAEALAQRNLNKNPYKFEVRQAKNGEYFWGCYSSYNGEPIAWSGETHPREDYARAALQRFINNIKKFY